VQAHEADLSLGGIATEAVGLYRRHWKLLAPLAVVVLLPQAVLGLLIGEVEVDHIESFGDVVHLLTIPLFTLVALGGEALLAGVITALVRQWRVGHRPLGARTFLRELPWVSLITADLLIAVGAAVGLLLLVIPGLVLLTYLAITPAVIEIEGRGVRDALRRSASLVQGQFLRVFVLVIGSLLITEGLAEGLAYVIHGLAPEFVTEIAIDAVLESAQGLIVALLAISLIQLRGEEIPPPRGRT
jgi:hypothetical protein